MTLKSWILWMKLMIQHKSSPAWTTLWCNYRSMQNSWKPITLMMHSQHCSPSNYNNTSKNQVQDVCNYIHIKRSQFVLQEEDTLIGRSAKLRCQLYWPAVLCLPRSFYTRGPTQGVLQKWLQTTLFSDTHRQVAQNKS